MRQPKDIKTLLAEAEQGDNRACGQISPRTQTTVMELHAAGKN